jgi:hypothetical protein
MIVTQDDDRGLIM